MKTRIGAILFAIACSIAPCALIAQPVVVDIPPGSRPRTIPTTATVTIGGTFSATPGTPPLTQNSQSGNLCSPGACYAGTVTTTGNHGWKLQVKLSTTPTAFTVAFVQTTTPPTAQAVNSGTRTVLNTTTWLTIAQGSTPTAGSSIGVMFNSNKVGGPNGFMPSGAQVAAVVQYQVIANP